jgi:pectinesterase
MNRVATLGVLRVSGLVPLLALVLTDPAGSASRQPARALSAAEPDAIVAADGSGQYRTVQDAIDAAPPNTNADKGWVIFVRAGTYRELLYVQREKRFVALIGEDPLRTILTYNLSASSSGPDGKSIGTFRTPSTVIDADDFSAENVTFENGAGPVGQALAVRVDGDRVVFRNCRFLGWQDTVFLNRGRQYFESSFIAGHVDFIFGGATAFFERCHLHCWRNGYVTAASTPATRRHGFVFANSRITGESPDVRTYLGRPWRDHAQTVFLNTDMGEVVRPEGWHNWARPERETTSRYAELGSTGAGARPQDRVPWAKPVSAAEAAAISVASVLGGTDGWDPRRVAGHPSAVRATGGTLALAPGFTIERVLADVGRAHPRVTRVSDDLPPGVTTLEALTYARRGDRDLQLDVYRPPAPGAQPAVLIVHGGGWEAGDRLMERPFAKRLAARGYVAVPVTYRLGPDGRFPAAVHDLKDAIGWLRAHAVEHGIDPRRIGAVGGSAGGELVAFLGATNGLAEFEGDGGRGAESSIVQAVVDIDGVANFVDPALIEQERQSLNATSRFLGGNHAQRATTWRAASPLTHLHARSAPTLFISSTAPRPILPGRDAMAARLRTLGIDAAVVVLPDTPHPFWLVHPWFDRVLDETDRFLSGHLRPDG